nr:DUF1189 family protein [Sporosarcina limicola]
MFEASPELIEYSKIIGWIIYPVAFLLQLVISTFYIFIRISIFAAVGLLLLKILKRRGEFRHMWRTAAIAITVPILLTIVLDFSHSMNGYSTISTSIIHLIYIATAVKYYPKAPQ